MKEIIDAVLHYYEAYKHKKNQEAIEKQLIAGSFEQIEDFLNEFFKFLGEKPYESTPYFNPSKEDVSLLEYFTNQDFETELELHRDKDTGIPRLMYFSNQLPVFEVSPKLPISLNPSSPTKMIGFQGGWNVNECCPENMDVFCKSRDSYTWWGFIFAQKKVSSVHDVAKFLPQEEVTGVQFRGDSFKIIERADTHEGVEEMATSYFYAGPRVISSLTHHLYLTSTGNQRAYKINTQEALLVSSF